MKSGVKKASIILIYLFTWLAFLLPPCFAEWPVPPPPTQDIYLVDDAGMVNSDDRQGILAMGKELDRETKAQVVVVTMNTLEGESIESYANRLFRTWGIGDKKKNNGVLLLIIKDDRKFRIEVGYGLEGSITDGYSGAVLDSMKADFRKGNYSPAILSAYAKLTKKAYEAESVDLPENVESAVTASGAAATSSSSQSEDNDEDWSWPEILLGLPIGLLLIGALLWCLWQMLRLVFMLFALLLFLLTSGAIDLTDWFPSGGGGGGGGFSGGGWSGGGGSSGGGGFGGGSSGGGGSSSGW